MVTFLSYRHLAVVGELQSEVVALRQVEVNAHLVKEFLPHGALLCERKGGDKNRRKENRVVEGSEGREAEGRRRVVEEEEKEEVGTEGRGATGGRETVRENR